MIGEDLACHGVHEASGEHHEGVGGRHSAEHTHDLPKTADTPIDRLKRLWRNGADWGGTCRALVVRLAFAGWSDADAVFELRFA
jgi:hypothetical protein